MKNKNSQKVNFKKTMKILTSQITMLPEPFKTKISSRKILSKKIGIKVIKRKIKIQIGEIEIISQNNKLSKKICKRELILIEVSQKIVRSKQIITRIKEDGKNLKLKKKIHIFK